MKNFEVVECAGILGTKKNKKGEKVEVRLQKVRWGAGVPQWDLRAWNLRTGAPEKGMSLTNAMIRRLWEILMTVEETRDGKAV